MFLRLRIVLWPSVVYRAVVPILTTMMVLGVLCTSGRAKNAFDPSGWKWTRALEITGSQTDRSVAVALPSDIIDKCRDDLRDIRLVDSTGSPVPVFVRRPSAPVRSEPFPAKVFRLERKPGLWTDIWVDKTAKVLTRGVRIDTSSQDFVRRIELRGSDNIRDQFVLRMDGLIAVIEKPVRLRSLDVKHPLSNFQYYHLRIIDDGKPPIRIASIRCYPPSPANPLIEDVDAAIVENRPNPATGETRLIIDLGEDRFPLVGITLHVTTDSFLKRLVISAANRYSAETWRTFYTGPIYRKVLGDVVKEKLEVTFGPRTERYYALTFLESDSPPVEVESVTGRISKPCLVIEPTTERRFKLFYGNESAGAAQKASPRSPEKIHSLLAEGPTVNFGREVKNVQRRKPPQKKPPVTEKSSWSPVTIIGVIALLAILVLIFALMLRSRSYRRNRRFR